MKNDELKMKSGRCVAFAVFVLGVALNLCFAADCRIEKMEWVGERSEFDELSMNAAVGAPCDGYQDAKRKCRLSVIIRTCSIISLQLDLK